MLFTGAIALSLLGLAAALQQPLAFQPYDEGLFTPFEDLSLLSTETFRSLRHPHFPDYNVRIKKSKVCDETVSAFTGYIDIQAKHLFFYFFESRNNPDKDDVIFWTSGGPGCSSAISLFMEHGPCKIHSINNVSYNPYSWNENANVFFVDQPVGVGFSYADYGETVGTTEDAAKDIAAFVAIFFEHFSKFKGRPFHMTSSSYGGRYIPAFASYVYDANAALVKAGITPINLKSIMIGNACANQLTMVTSYYEMQCMPKTIAPVNTISACVTMKQALPRCHKMLKEQCYDITDYISCAAAQRFCGTVVDDTFYRTGLNPYDINKQCEGPIGETLCYPLTVTVARYLDRPDIREALGVDSSFTGNFTGCSNDVSRRFGAHQDYIFPSELYIAALLERGIKTLLYVGVNDWICNWVGNEQLTLNMEWTGQQEFKAQPLRDWHIDGEVAGKTRSAGALTFATIYNAGHLVGYNAPKELLEVVQRWLADEEL